MVKDPTQFDIIEDVEFLLVYMAEDLEALKADGLLGLAPNAPSDHPYDTLVTDMYNQGMIRDNVFSMYLAKTDVQSKLWIGGFDANYVREALSAHHDEVELAKLTDEELE